MLGLILDYMENFRTGFSFLCYTSILRLILDYVDLEERLVPHSWNGNEAT